ncbi:restriction endonuclease subunit S [Corynebacterium hindlerae]|uniref:restriction endonuclease subunit S n=1 Tax=Corynebacterium hindlerae TaxID=699041 RepID=UPI0031B6EBD9
MTVSRETWPMVRLGDVCDRKIGKWDLGTRKKYVDISSVDSISKKVIDARYVDPEEAPSRARQVVQEGDVLVSTVRPNLNAVALVSSSLDGHVTSTGFCVLRPDETILNSTFLFSFVQTNYFIEQCVKTATGISYPATTATKILDIKIPLPPLAEQRRIAEILEKSKSGIDLVNFQISKIDRILRAPLFDVDDDSGTTIGNYVQSISSGKNLKPAEEENFQRVLKVSAVTSGYFDSTESKPLPKSYSPPESHLVNRGDLLVSRANTAELVGASVVVDRDVSSLYLPDKIWRVTPKSNANNYFLWHLLQLKPMRGRISQVSTGSSGSMKNISQSAFLSVLAPEVEETKQCEVAEIVKLLLQIRSGLQRKLALLQQLHQTLATRAFAGQL